MIPIMTNAGAHILLLPAVLRALRAAPLGLPGLLLRTP